MNVSEIVCDVELILIRKLDVVQVQEEVVGYINLDPSSGESRMGMC